MTEVDPYVELFPYFGFGKRRFPVALERESDIVGRRIHAWDRLSVAEAGQSRLEPVRLSAHTSKTGPVGSLRV